MKVLSLAVLHRSDASIANHCNLRLSASHSWNIISEVSIVVVFEQAE